MCDFHKKVFYFIGFLLLFFMELSYFAPTFPLWKFDLLPDYRFFGCLLVILLLIAVWKGKFLELMGDDNFKKGAGTFLIIFVLHLAVHFHDITHQFWRLNTDNNLTSWVTSNILNEGLRPIYWFNQTYLGVLQAYFYGVLTLLIGDITTSVIVGNSLMFSLGIFVFGKLLKEILNYSWLVITLMLTPTGVLLYLGSSDAKGYPLIVLLISLILYNSFKYCFHKSETIHWIGFFSGLLFAQYQPALLFIGGVGLFPLAKVLKEKSFFQILIGVCAFIAGALPHIMGEFYTGFVNFRHMFLANSGSAIERLFDLKGVLKFFIYYPSSIENYTLSKIAFLTFFFLGFFVLLYRSIKEKNLKYSFIPIVYIYICFFSNLSGHSFEQNRYAMHYHIYVPVAIIIAAGAFDILRNLKWKAYFKYTVIAIVILGSGIRMVNNYHHTKRKNLEMLDNFTIFKQSKADLLVGEYWFNMRFQYLFDDKIFLTDSMFPGQYLTFGGMSPHSPVKCAAKGDLHIGVVLNGPQSRQRFEAFLGALGAKFKAIRGRFMTIYEDIEPKLSLEAAFYGLRHWQKFEKSMIHNAPLWEILDPNLELKGRVLTIKGKKGSKLAPNYKLFDLKLIDKETNRSLMVHFKFNEGKVKYILPENAGLKTGKYRGDFYYMGVPVKSMDFNISGEDLEGTFYLSKLTEEIRLMTINSHSEELKKSKERERYSFGVVAPTKQFKNMCHHYLGIDEYFLVGGFPLEEKIDVGINKEGVTNVELEVYSLIDFDSMKWGKKLVQQLIVKTGNRDLFFNLKPGFNRVKFPVYNGAFTIDSKHKSYFYGFNSVVNYIQKCGVLINSIKGIKNSETLWMKPSIYRK